MDVAELGGTPPKGAQAYWFSGYEGLRLRVMVANPEGVSRGSVVLAHGRTEFIEKYYEVIGELQARGFSVFSMDWRGQGLSDRELSNSQKGHLRSLDHAVADLEIALAAFEDKLPRPWILLAHSMGGGICLRALQLGKLSVAGAAFSAPMWGVKALSGMAGMFVRSACAFGASGLFAPGVSTKWEREVYQDNPVTWDEARHAHTQDLIEGDPRLAIAGATIGWAGAVTKAFGAFRKKDALSHITIPILVGSAADEMLVDNDAHTEICARLPNSNHIVFDGAKHELLMEKDNVRARFMAEFDMLADEVAPKGA